MGRCVNCKTSSCTYSHWHSLAEKPAMGLWCTIWPPLGTTTGPCSLRWVKVAWWWGYSKMDLWIDRGCLTEVRFCQVREGLLRFMCSGVQLEFLGLTRPWEESGLWEEFTELLGEIKCYFTTCLRCRERNRPDRLSQLGVGVREDHVT